MTESNAQNLSRAFDLIEAEQLNEARALLEPILTQDVNNVEAWWLYAHAVEDRNRAKDALNNVLRLDPNYPGAKELMKATEGSSTSSFLTTEDEDFDDFSDFDDDFDDDEDAGIDMDSLGKADDEDEDFDDFSDFDDDFDDDGEDEDKPPLSRRQIIFRLLAIVVLILVFLLVFVIINPFGGDNTDDQPEATNTPQSVVNLPTDIPATSETIPTNEPTPTSEVQAQSGSAFDVLYSAMRNRLQIVEDSAEIRQSALGQTLLISVCSSLGDSLRSDLDQAMRIYSEQNDSIMDSSIEAVGITILDCDANEILNEIAVSRDQVVAFAEGTISFTEFRSNWQSLG